MNDLLVLICFRLPLATVLGLMSISKLARVRQVSDRMWQPVPLGHLWWPVVVVVAVSVVELLVAAITVMGRRAGAVMGLGLLCLLSVYGVGAVRYRHDCGCWGHRSHGALPRFLLRNAILILLAAGSALAPPTTLASLRVTGLLLAFAPCALILLLLASAAARLPARMGLVESEGESSRGGWAVVVAAEEGGVSEGLLATASSHQAALSP